ncbi:hypothetical protein AB833_27850 [Chromatiales bacterium (ex Bugula neritina AB1)]|nr:hypothetical protein AB833_27850 [Chromatiales bacterium (ex Bugula neritina AB1)]
MHTRISGAALERGFQHGFLLGEEIAACLRSNKFWAYWMTARQFSFFADKAMQLYVDKQLIPDELLQEMQGIASGASKKTNTEISFRDILTWNCFVDLIYSGWGTFKQELSKNARDVRAHRYTGHRCSAFVAVGDATHDGGIVMTHTTWDAFLQAQHFNVIMDITPDTGHRMVMQTAPGWIASMMDFTVTSAGLLVTETTIDGYIGFDPAKPPEFSESRLACQYASDIDDWTERMAAGNNGGYANSWLLGDINSGEIARYETGLIYQTPRPVEKLTNGVLYGQNIATDMNIRNLETDDPDAWSDISQSGARRVRWKKLLNEHYGKINVENTRRMIGDHHDEFLQINQPSSRTLCGHMDNDNGRASGGHGHPPFYPWGSVDAKVATTQSARAMGFDARWGRACGEAFIAEDYLTQHPQYDWLEGYLIDRPAQQWQSFVDE